MKKKKSVTSGLKKVLGFPSLFIIAVGMVVSQSSVAAILQGAGIGGGSFFMAILIAFILTLCYVSTYSELSLMMPKAGSISTYTAVSIGHFPAIIATVAGYLAPAIFGGPAELLLLQHVLDSVAPGSFTHIALMLLWVLALLNILGINLFCINREYYCIYDAGNRARNWICRIKPCQCKRGNSFTDMAWIYSPRKFRFFAGGAGPLGFFVF
jgi:amino acid transporter